MASQDQVEGKPGVSEEKQKPTELSIGRIVAWGIGSITVLLAVGLLFTSTLSGIVMLVAGLFALPPTNRMIADEFNVRFSRWFVVLGYLVLLMIAAGVVSA